MMELTLGDEAALTEETISETLYRVTEEIKGEENQKLLGEMDAHRSTREDLIASQKRNRNIIKNIYWECDRKAKFRAGIVTAAIAIISLLGVATTSIQLVPESFAVPVIVIAVVLMLPNLWLGITVIGIHNRLSNHLRTSLLRRRALGMGIDPGEFMQ